MHPEREFVVNGDLIYCQPKPFYEAMVSQRHLRTFEAALLHYQLILFEILVF
jgi:hypothetical protein